MKVWLIKAHCGDYYCGADHVVAIAACYEDVPALVKAAQEQRVQRTGIGNGSYRRWETVEVPMPDETVDIGIVLP